jgi:hypothetical protein
MTKNTLRVRVLFDEQYLSLAQAYDRTKITTFKTINLLKLEVLKYNFITNDIDCGWTLG